MPTFCKAVRPRLPLIAVLLGVTAFSSTWADEIFVIEKLPDPIQARLELRDRQLASYLPVPGDGPSFTIDITKSWGPGATVRVAFRGGDTNLRRQIAQTAITWAQYANLKLDFGPEDQPRDWSPSDPAYVAEVRISFDQAGYWSLVGTDSMDPNIVSSGEASMNLRGFDRGLPPDWQAIVLHEFGHALGFEHEHQHPVGGCNSEFRWSDDPGYQLTRDAFGQYVPDSKGRRPGIFTRLGGPPNYWPRDRVESNLKQLKPSHAFVTGPFDRQSIMKYEFPAWMFVRGEQSRCYSSRNSVVSDQDKEGASLVYPRHQAPALATLDKQIKIFEDLLKVQNLPDEIRKPYEDLLRSARNRRQQLEAVGSQ